MRRYLLILTIISTAGWSQPAQQQVQPPIVVQIQTPPESIWTTLLKAFLPTILGVGLGSGITLYGLRQTNKHNAHENRANREHQLQVEIAKAEIAAKYKSDDNRWGFRKDVYVNLITDVVGLLRFIEEYETIEQLKQVHSIGEEWQRLLSERTKANTEQFMSHIHSFNLNVAMAPLPIADKAVAAIQHVIQTFEDTAIVKGQYVKVKDGMKRMLKLLQEAARNELWGDTEPEAKAEAASQN